MQVSRNRRGKDLTCIYTEERPDLARELPNWMFDEVSCAGMSLAEAEVAYKEAAAIRREPASQNPAAYRPALAQTLNNLASLYRGMHRDSDAKSVEAEATAAGK